MYKVLVSDALGEAGIQLFQEAEGIAVDVNTGLSAEALEAIMMRWSSAARPG